MNSIVARRSTVLIEPRMIAFLNRGGRDGSDTTTVRPATDVLGDSEGDHCNPPQLHRLMNNADDRLASAAALERIGAK